MALAETAASEDGSGRCEQGRRLIPLTGPVNVPGFMRRLQVNAEQIGVYCQRVTVTPTPEHQRFVVEVPAMKPLPQPVARP